MASRDVESVTVTLEPETEGETTLSLSSCPLGPDDTHTFPDFYDVGDFCNCATWQITYIYPDRECLDCLNVAGLKYHFTSSKVSKCH